MPITITKSKITSKNVRALISEAAQEILSDPDFALELTLSAKNRLRSSKLTSKTRAFSEIKKKYL